MQPAETWTRVPLAKIEDLSDAVLGAGLEATQMSTGQLSGGLAFSETDGVVCTSGLINGRVALFGPLSQDMITIGVGLRLEPGTRHWLNEVETGNVGVFFPGDEHDSIYTSGSLYATITASAETLEREAAKEDLILDRHILGGTGVHARNLASGPLTELRRSFQCIHDGCAVRDCNAVGRKMLAAVIAHLARPPHYRNVGRHSSHHGKIVERARVYIQEHLCEPMSVDEIAAAAYTSRRTLFRAFEDILNEAPHHYVRRLRLHRIRHDLASEAERTCTIALIANQWGISDLGRMSGWYRELFGERPSETIATFSRRY
ncbi:helix-turn-helix domain-containing protein [Bradyrhizobium sp. USDA 3364]